MVFADLIRSCSRAPRPASRLSVSRRSRTPPPRHQTNRAAEHDFAAPRCWWRKRLPSSFAINSSFASRRRFGGKSTVPPRQRCQNALPFGLPSHGRGLALPLLRPDFGLDVGHQRNHLLLTLSQNPPLSFFYPPYAPQQRPRRQLASKSGIAPTSAGAPLAAEGRPALLPYDFLPLASAATLASKARSSPSCGAALVVGVFCFLLLLLLALRQSRARIFSSSRDGAWPKWGCGA